MVILVKDGFYVFFKFVGCVSCYIKCLCDKECDSNFEYYFGVVMEVEVLFI